MKLSSLLPVAVLCGLCVGSSSTARAAISLDGDFSPSDPSTWNVSTPGYIGNTAAGTLTVDGDSDLTTYSGYIGYDSTATGFVNVSGSGSSWKNSYGLYVGYLGSGTLSIAAAGRVWYGLPISNTYLGYGPGSSGMVTVDGNGSYFDNYNLHVGYLGSGTLTMTNGSKVNVSNGSTYVGWDAGATGLIDFGAGGGTLTTPSLFASPSQLTGTGRIIAHGLVSDYDLTFDSSHPLSQSILWQQSGETVTLRLQMSSTTAAGSLGAGWRDAGSLTIQDGLTVASTDGYLGYVHGASGVATVSGSNSTWATSGSISVGHYGSGTLSVVGGGKVTNAAGCYLGYEADASGAATVSGTGSTWVGADFYVGRGGHGSFSVANGGSVSTNGLACIAHSVNSSGEVSIDGPDSVWQHSGLFSVGGADTLDGSGGHATLSITNGGKLLSGDYDCGYIGVGADATGVATVDGAGSTWNNGYFWVGYRGGTGTLAVTGGGSFHTLGASIGREYDSVGAVTISGPGSKWDMSNGLAVLVGCYGGTGSLSIRNGGTVVSDRMGYGLSSIGYMFGSTGIAVVDGTGSTWTNTYTSVEVGNASLGGTGTLSITGGGKVTGLAASVSYTSLLAIDVGRGSSLVASTFTNGGTVRILAGAGVPFDSSHSVTYSPISATTWSGFGIYQPVGGTWDATNHLFTASGVTPGTSGSPVAIDRALVQRVLIDDDGEDGTGWSVGASFLAAAGPASMTFTAAAVADAVLGGQEVLGAWTFATTGYDVSESNPIYLSFDVGAKYPADELHVWHYDGSVWTPYSPFDLTYDGTYASFTVTSLSGYAVTPEPGTLALLAVAMLGLIAWARRRRRSP
jgi:T5SS/PEP-CTERM-associated repeat protein